MNDIIKKVGVVTFLFFTINSTDVKSSNNTDDNKQTVNAVIGDISFFRKFGETPNAKTDEDLRIKTHLAYVEILLRNSNTDYLSKEIAIKRRFVIDLLHNYWTSGIFPKNYDYKDQRLPCFIDKDENICAVGYLIEKTEGRAIVNEINKKYKYDFISSMNDKNTEGWAKKYGLTKLECAMIQPTYNFERPIEMEIIEPIWNGNGKHKLYNENKQLREEGVFKKYQLYNGKKYVYDRDGALTKIMRYKKGKYVEACPLKEKTNTKTESR